LVQVVRAQVQHAEPTEQIRFFQQLLQPAAVVAVRLVPVMQTRMVFQADPVVAAHTKAAVQTAVHEQQIKVMSAEPVVMIPLHKAAAVAVQMRLVLRARVQLVVMLVLVEMESQLAFPVHP
jgi:hypothetical protein